MNGNLSVSRAIGDAPDKKFVIGVGDISVADIDGTEDYLMLACDGIWDVLSMEEIVTCVHAHLASPGGSKQTVAKAIIQLAKSEGSGDNMTVIVSFFSTFTPPPRDPPTQDPPPQDPPTQDPPPQDPPTQDPPPRDPPTQDPPTQDPPPPPVDCEDKSCVERVDTSGQDSHSY